MIFLDNFMALFLESAPWLLLGLVMAGLLKVFVPMSWMNQQLGGHGLKSTVKAALFGAPLPLCSCGVIPAAIGLRRAGASKAATTSFLVSTPETGVDSISVSYVLLGPFMAIVRPIAAMSSAILAGLLVGKEEKQVVSGSENTSIEGCCSQSVAPVTSGSSCCSSRTSKPSEGVLKKTQAGLVYAATEMLDDTAVWLVTGLVFAALIQTYVPDGFLASWGNGLLAMLVMMMISVPMYICATASTPVAAGLLLAGVAPGAVLVFMLAGPATNIATLGVVAKELGKRALVGYLGGVLGGALIFGYLVDIAVMHFNIAIVPQIGPEHELTPVWLTVSTGALLGLLMVISITKKITVRMMKAPKCCS
ncbi:SO_0444 family Cu/Zn efflux transporter [Marinomonas algarum]|uniref:SO_0444 family Cu/Zn efflux transporter n=1 Tax=Marinomonas algarum TaxID=2883105 RepID=A0A9X1IPI8_9GAMM|nr:SO_0444 family Cu/Zn efflux transporter [Marinomonas algarum]MCB5162797.1 SO_0444 family Cu/Zn efflux transporter [Marinomonas algarum]